MQKQIRRVGLVLLLLFVLVFANLNYLQVFNAKAIADNPHNVRRLYQEYSVKRGNIVTADGKVVATSKPTKGNLKYERVYPGGSLYGHLTGYFSLVYGMTGIESAYDSELSGHAGVLSMQDIEDELLGSGQRGDDVVMTVNSKLQEVARQALGNQRGAVVALDPRTGDIKAMWSNPSYDPSGLAVHNTKAERRYWRSLDPTSPDSPLIDLARQARYPPGSTFKIVDTTAALQSGAYSPSSTFPDPPAIPPCSSNGGAFPCMPQTNQSFTNFSHTSCAGGGRITLAQAVTVSCDTTFALIGLRIFPSIFRTAEAYGFNHDIPFDLSVERSRFPFVGTDNKPFRAYSAVGQGNVAATPLQMALVAATVANGGVEPRPRLVKEIVDPSGDIVQRFSPQSLGRVMSPGTAHTITRLMESVVQKGTGTAAQIPGVPVAGKTGTAQNVAGAAPHAWFICFAPADNPKIAVAVLVEHGGTLGNEATGGAVSAPIAKRIIEADRQIEGW